MAPAAFAANDTQIVTCTVNAAADGITAPADDALVTTRLATDESDSALTLTYNTDVDGTRDITAVASAGTGTAVVGAKLNIKGEDLVAYTLLATGGTYEAAVTLDTNVAATDSGSIADIYLQLDASGVASGAANLGASWTYTVTYTIADS